MHQHPRPSPRSASAASNPSTNPERTNNSRDRPLPVRNRSSVDLASYTERAGGETPTDQYRPEAVSGGQDRETTKLNQIIQHFHTKAALTICSARANLPQVYAKNGEIKQNRWNQPTAHGRETGVDSEEESLRSLRSNGRRRGCSDEDGKRRAFHPRYVLFEDLRKWKRFDLTEKKPPPLVIEVFLDTSTLSHNQALAIVDDSGKRWDVADALKSSTGSSPPPTRKGARFCEVVLERWTIELGDADDYSHAALNDALPNVYKKGVVVFRSLHTFARMLPAWKLYRKVTRQPGNHQALRIKFRITQGQGSAHGARDSLYAPLCPDEQMNASPVQRWECPPVLCRAGPLSIAVDYRTNSDFGVADAEALLSSRFLGLEDSLPIVPAGRSLPSARGEQPRTQYGSSLGGRVPDQRPRVGAYGSLGTFHGLDKRGSPVGELRQRALLDEDNEELGQSINSRGEPFSRPASLNLVQNPPFKAGSLASSPKPSASPSTSVSRAESLSKLAGTSASKRLSLNTLPQQALRAPSLPNETAIASSGSSSPKPAPVHRYSSSFANRSRRFTSQSSKTAESNASSGRGSSSSKEKSGQLTSGSSGSAKNEEDDIASFISQVESAKDLASFRSRPSSRDNTVNLAKYSMKREPNMQLAEEMTSSSLIQSSATPPSRRLSNVPGLSTSSSPSRTLAHAPHVRSRLSTNSIVEEGSGAKAGIDDTPDSPKDPEAEEEDEEEDEPFIFPQDNV